MAYLYGDSSESPLDFNYLEFLRDAIDFAVAVLLSDHRIVELAAAGELHKKSTEQELGELRELSQQVVAALASPPGTAKSSSHRCAVRIRQAAEDSIKLAVNQLKQGVAERMSSNAQQTIRERQSNLVALQRLLTQQELPNSVHEVEITLDHANAGYVARDRGGADLALNWLQALDIPSDHLFGQLAKVEKLAPNLEFKVPEKGGWLKKGMRLRTHKVNSKYITELVRARHQTTLKLRAQPEEDQDGYNILVTQMEPRVRLVRVQTGGEHSPPFEPVDEDVGPLLDLVNVLCEEADKLLQYRGELLEARFENIPLAEHERPSNLVKKLVAKMAPVVQGISKHSLSPTELVLKRVLAGDRREEVFVSKQDLKRKLETVPVNLRGIFAPLGLGDLADPKPPPGRGPPKMALNSARPSPLADDTKEVHITVSDGEEGPTGVMGNNMPNANPKHPDQPKPPSAGPATPTLMADLNSKQVEIVRPPRPGATLPPIAPAPKNPPKMIPSATVQDLPAGPPADDEVTTVGGSKPDIKVGDDSIDIALNELEREN